MLLRSCITILLLYSILCVDFINGYVQTIYIDNSCTTDIMKANEDKSYQLVWKGGDPGYCKITFIGEDTKIWDDYIVCVEPQQFDFTRSGIYLKYYVGFNLNPSKTYEKGDYPEKFCAGKNQFLDVQLDIDDGASTLNSEFILKVTATKTKNYDATVGTVGTIVGGVIGGLVLLGIAVTVCIVIARRRKGYAGHVNNPTTVPIIHQDENQSAAYPQQTVGYGQSAGFHQQQQMAYPPPTGYIQSGTYPVQGYGYPGQQYQQPPHQEPNTAAPPPSYDEVTKPSQT